MKAALKWLTVEDNMNLVVWALIISPLIIMEMWGGFAVLAVYGGYEMWKRDQKNGATK